MSRQDFQQVCLNGHQITDSINEYPGDMRRFCETCGAKTITQCAACGASIPGHEYTEGILFPYTASIPEHCHNCGGSYPWTGKMAVGSEPKTIESAEAYITNILSRFHLVTNELRERYADRSPLIMTDEYDVQYLLHALLKLHFDDVRAEEVTPSYAGKSARMDFLLHAEEIVIETKMTRKTLTDKEIGTQLIEDIVRYEKHEKCRTLFCFLYDPFHYIKNPTGIEKDLSRKTDELQVKVLIVPKGL